MDCIRSITQADTPEDFGRRYGHLAQTFFFTNEPSRVKEGDLMFFAHESCIKAFAVVTKGPYHMRDSYWIDVGWFHDVRNEKLPFKGYTSLRYLDTLTDQYGGKYKDLCKKLARIAADYRADRWVQRSTESSSNRIK